MDKPILVIDLEATCSEDDSIPPASMEIIEVGAVWATSLGVVLDSFQDFVRPVVKHHLTDFCINLTGISQETVDSAPTWPSVVADLLIFLNCMTTGPGRVGVPMTPNRSTSTALGMEWKIR